MFGILKPKVPQCPVCDNPLIAIDVVQVPSEARREFARLNRWQPMEIWGWKTCQICKFYLHQPTIDRQGQRR